MADRIQVRRDTDADWTSNNPTLAAGELFFISDTKEFGVGDGTTAATSLDTVKLDGPRGVLGYAEVTSDQAGLSGGPAGLSGLAPATVTVPANRRIRVTGKVNMQINGTGRLIILVRNGSTILTRVADFSNHTDGQRDMAFGSVVLDGPAAGDYDFNIAYQLVSGTSFDSEATSTNPAFILVEDIGPA